MVSHFPLQKKQKQKHTIFIMRHLKLNGRADVWNQYLATDDDDKSDKKAVISCVFTLCQIPHVSGYVCMDKLT